MIIEHGTRHGTYLADWVPTGPRKSITFIQTQEHYASVRQINYTQLVWYLLARHNAVKNGSLPDLAIWL